MQNNFTLSFRQHNTKGRQPWPIDKVYDSLQREIWKRASDSDGLFWCKCGKQVCKVLVHSWKFVAACRETCEVGEQEYKGLKRQSNSSRRKSDQKNQKRESHSEINTSIARRATRTETKFVSNEHATNMLHSWFVRWVTLQRRRRAERMRGSASECDYGHISLWYENIHIFDQMWQYSQYNVPMLSFDLNVTIVTTVFWGCSAMADSDYHWQSARLWPISEVTQQVAPCSKTGAMQWWHSDIEIKF